MLLYCAPQITRVLLSATVDIYFLVALRRSRTVVRMEIGRLCYQPASVSLLSVKKYLSYLLPDM